MADLNSKSIIFNIIGLIFSIACFGYSIGFHWNIETVMMLFVVTIFAGFMIFYIALTIGIVAGEEAGKNLVAIWVLYAACAYTSIGIVLIIMFNYTNITIGLVAGNMVLVFSAIKFLDYLFTLME